MMNKPIVIYIEANQVIYGTVANTDSRTILLSNAVWFDESGVEVGSFKELELIWSQIIDYRIG